MRKTDRLEPASIIMNLTKEGAARAGTIDPKQAIEHLNRWGSEQTLTDAKDLQFLVDLILARGEYIAAALDMSLMIHDHVTAGGMVIMDDDRSMMVPPEIAKRFQEILSALPREDRPRKPKH